MTPAELEVYYHLIIEQLVEWPTEGICHINLALLDSLGLLEHWEESASTDNYQFCHSFHVYEAEEKITLFNHKYVIWIIPQQIRGEAITLTLISLLNEPMPKLEILLVASGVFNTSRLVLQVIEALLDEIKENEDCIHGLA